MVSPNIKDIAGLGEIVGHIKDFLLQLIENKSAREERRLKNEGIKLENIRKFLEIAKMYNLNPEQLKYYENLVNGDQILNVDLIHMNPILVNAIESSNKSRPDIGASGSGGRSSSPGR